MVKYPDDWTKSTLGDCVQITRGASPRPIESFLTTSVDGVNWIKIGDAPKEEKYITHTAEKITISGAMKSVSVCAGDFILSNSMSFGRPYILAVDGCIHDGWLRLYDYHENIDKDFLYYILSSDFIQAQYAAFAAGSGVQNLNKEVVKKVTIYLPPLSEQKAIAETITIFDTHIDNLTELIEKKKTIRDAILEDLISGKTRINGFNRDWIEFPLENLCTIITKQTGFDYTETIKNSLLDSKKGDVIPFIQNKDFDGTFVNLHTDYYIPKSVALKFPQILLDEKCLLISISGKIGNVGVYDNPELAFVGGAICIARLIDKNYTEWVMRFLRSSIGQYELKKTEKTSSHHNLTVEDIRKINIPIPPKEEADTILSVISTMDNEIHSLKEEKEKILTIRKGVMDELLTGKVRLMD